jgi:hypothetical protein
MKTMIFATAAVLGIGIGSALAGEGEGPTADTLFTRIPGVVAQPQVPHAPGAVATDRRHAPTAAFVTGHSRSISLFPPNQNQGSGN